LPATEPQFAQQQSDQQSFALREASQVGPSYSVIPVVGDGRWIWTRPPEGPTGYLEPRKFRVKIGIELQGAGRATQIRASTPVPVGHPEQTIESAQASATAGQANLRELPPAGGQLVFSLPEIHAGQTVRAEAELVLTLRKEYHNYRPELFPARQQPPREIQNNYFRDSPGIQSSHALVRDLARELTAGKTHPWDMARAFAEWIPRNIQPQLGSYTSVTAALENRRGDCEEMAGVFVALCRAKEIPARLVWVPNHAWSEFYLTDTDGIGHWIPAHTACYAWFGWNGAHELVLQKGDRYQFPERRDRLRLLDDWLQWVGRRPQVRFTGELTPLADETNTDPGPGARVKDATGEWKLTGAHPLDAQLRR